MKSLIILWRENQYFYSLWAEIGNDYKGNELFICAAYVKKSPYTQVPRLTTATALPPCNKNKKYSIFSLEIALMHPLFEFIFVQLEMCWIFSLKWMNSL